MKNDIVLINIKFLKPHERINHSHLANLINLIKKDGYLKNPVIADAKSLTVLDGHHRLNAMRKLGYKKIPVFLVNYRSKDIRVYLRRKDTFMDLLKEMVIKNGEEKRLFPDKTTRHLLKYRPKNIKVDLKMLK